MKKIICILEKGFSKIALPDGYVVNILTCDDGCFITTDNIKKDIKKINKYIGFPIYEICLDNNNNISKGFRLEKCEITNHNLYDFEYACIFWNTKSISGDNHVIDVE